MVFGAVVAVILGLILGFVSGGLLYRQSRRWCPACGASTVDLASRRQQAMTK